MKIDHSIPTGKPRFCCFAEEHGKSITAVALTALAFLAVGGVSLYFRATPIATASGFIIGGGLISGDLFAAIALYKEKEVDPYQAAEERFFEELYSSPEEKSEDQFSLYDYFISLCEEEGNQNSQIIDAVLQVYLENHPEETPFKEHLSTILSSLLTSQPVMKGRSCNLGDKTTLQRRYTVADGSCGFHAIVGKPDQRGFYRCNAGRERAHFCAHLQTKFEQGDLPEEIESELLDYASHLDRLPFTITDGVSISISNLASSKLGLMEQRGEQREIDEINKQITNALFPAYLQHISKVNIYLSQPELIAVAKFYNKTLVLYQPEGVWSNGSTKLVYETFNEQEDQEVVHVYFNGRNHYERVEIVKN